MPIITTPGQQTQPVPKQDTATTLPPRLQSAFTPTAVQPIVPPQPAVTPPVTGGLDTGFDEDDDNDDFGPLPSSTQSGKTSLSLSRMSEEERRKTINSVFSLVLGKEPTDRDYSYYRFSTLTEDGLIKSLLNLPEHKKLVEKAREHASLKQGMSDLDLQVKQLDTSMQSMKQELITMQQLLVEKNRYIQQMRGIPVESDNIQPSSPLRAPVPEVSTPVQKAFVQQAQEKKDVLAVETRKLPGPMDEIKNIFSGIFGGKR